MKIKMLTQIFLLSLFLLSCSPTEPDNNCKLTLTVDDVSCTEVWLKLSTEGLPSSSVVNINRDGNLIAKINNAGNKDTTIYIDSLLPNKTYTFQAITNENSAINYLSEKITATTMDTTSHDFTWQSWEFGESGAGSCTLYDVAIIDENNIWAVGEIYLKDSLGNPDPEQYAVAHWNGNEWKLMKLKFNCRLYYPNCGPETMLISSGYAIFANSVNDIWIAAGTVHHFNGTRWTEEGGIIGAGSANKIWGIPEDLWFVGSGGFIARRNMKGAWQKIESGTTLNIGTIWGVENGSGGYNKYLAAGDAMFILNPQDEVTIIKAGLGIYINSLWGITDELIYTAGEGIVLYKNKKWEKIDRTDLNTVYGIKGDNFNNVFGLSSTSTILHFNGFSWHPINTVNTNIYYRLDVKDDIMTAVGWQGDKAVITLIKRKN